MTEQKTYPVPEAVAKRAWIDRSEYDALYAASVHDPERFWSEQAETLTWIAPFKKVKDCSFLAEDLHVRWFAGGKLNVSANCLDRHLVERGEQTAILWESDDGKTTLAISYRELHEKVCRFANALKALGVEKGDRVTIYMGDKKRLVLTRELRDESDPK